MSTAHVSTIPQLAAIRSEMESLDRMNWTAGLTLLAFGRRIGVRVNDPDILKLLPNHLPYGWKRAEGATVERLYSLFASGRQNNPKLRRSHFVFAGAVELARSLNLSEILQALERDARLFVAERARRRIFVHAAAVGWNGRAIVIPGKSMSGKTTLAAEFVRAGATYYSDEYAVLDARGRVHPYAKPLSIRNSDDYHQADFPAEAFGGRIGTVPLPVGMLLVTRYRRGSRWRPREISSGMGALALLANTVAARSLPERTMNVVRNALVTASVLAGIRGEATGVVESVLRP